MDVNANADVKITGMPVVTAVEKNDKEKPQVAPVEKSFDSSEARLREREQEARAEDRAKEKSSLRPEQMERIGEEIQARLDKMGTSLGFSLHQDDYSDIIVARVTNKKSGELVKQIPSEEIIELREKLQEVAGILFDEKV